MSSPEFMPLSQTLDKTYCQELIGEGVMPSAVVCLVEADSEKVFSVSTRNRLSGLPIIDLARMGDGETPEHYASYRLKRKYGFRLPKGTLQLIPVESSLSARIKDIGNPEYQSIHHRIYFPVVGRTDVLPEKDTIRAVGRDQVLDDIASPQGGDVLYQLIDVHRELLYSYTW